MIFAFEYSAAKEPKDSTYYYAENAKPGVSIYLDEELTKPYYCEEHKDTHLVLDVENWPTCWLCFTTKQGPHILSSCSIYLSTFSLYAREDTATIQRRPPRTIAEDILKNIDKWNKVIEDTKKQPGVVKHDYGRSSISKTPFRGLNEKQIQEQEEEEYYDSLNEADNNDDILERIIYR